MFNQELMQLRESGALARIVARYTSTQEDRLRECHGVRTKKTSLGMYHLSFPFVILGAAVAASLLLAGMERAIGGRRTKRTGELVFSARKADLVKVKLKKLRAVLDSNGGLHTPQEKLLQIADVLADDQSEELEEEMAF